MYASIDTRPTILVAANQMPLLPSHLPCLAVGLPSENFFLARGNHVRDRWI